MASAELRKELECSVCLTVYTDPVNLRCGHNFCRGCIDQHLDTQEGSGVYSCPECRERFMVRPALQRNIALRNIAERFLSTQSDQEKTGVSCTYCVDFPVRAVMSCLHCDASLCDNHLRVHSKAPEHVLCDPNTSLENRKCSVHKKILEYYCTEDAASICVYCSAGEHRGHQVETLVEASEKKKQKLRNDLQKLTAETEEVEKRVQNLQERKRKEQEKADDETERVTALFKNLRKRLKNLEKRVLSDIIMEEEQVSLSYEYVIIDLEIKKRELSRKMCHIEELCDMSDPLTVLQESDTDDLSDSEEKHNEDREKKDKQLDDDGWEFDVEGLSHALHVGLLEVLSDLNVLKCTDTQICRHYKTNDTTTGISWPLPQPTPLIECEEVGDEELNVEVDPLDLSLFADILLDEDTAGNYLHIPFHKKNACSSDRSYGHPETPQRFLHDPQVLSVQSFSSGQHYWEVDVGRSMWWRIGMCYPSMDRRGDRSVIGCNEKSWCLYRWDKQYSVIHDNKVLRLRQWIPTKRVRVNLDYEAMQISFYAPHKHLKLIHTFNANFTEPLHAAIWVAEGYIKISGAETWRYRQSTLQ